MINIDELMKLINLYKKKYFVNELNKTEESIYMALEDLLIYKIGEQKGTLISCNCSGCTDNGTDINNDESECIHCARAFSDCYTGKEIKNITQLKETLKGTYADVEVYVIDNSKKFRGKIARKHPVTIQEEDDMQVLEYVLADEDCYREYISDSQAPVDYKDWFGDKDAKILCVLAR